MHVAEPGADFNHFYAAAKLVGTGQLYDWKSIQEVERPRARTLLHYGRLPFYAFTIKWMSALPYGFARVTWLLLSVCALLVFAAGWPAERRADLIVMLCWSCPAGVLLAIGQDSALFLFCWTVGVLLLRSERDLAAGLVLSLCAGKPHLALGIPVFLIARRKWTTLGAALGGGIIQLAVSFAVQGTRWPANLLRAVSSPDFSPAPDKMPNLHGLTYWLPHGAVVESVTAVLVLAAVWFISRRSTLVAGAAAAILGGLLVGHHAYVYDCVLMMPALALARESGAPRFLARWAVALVTPVPYLLLMSSRTAGIGQVLVTGFSVVLLGWLAGHGLARRPDRTMAHATRWIEEDIEPGYTVPGRLPSFERGRAASG
jgi:hypothetical protein